MNQYIYPSQNRFNDPHEMRIKDLGTQHKQKYLSREANNIIKAFADNIVLNGLEVTPTYVGTVINIALTSGILIHDSTLIALPEDCLLNCDVTGLTDTTTGSHIAIFSEFQYIETPDEDNQTPLKISLYHVNGDGSIVTPFPGCPDFNPDKHKILISALNFTRVGTNITSCSVKSDIAENEYSPKILVNGTYYYIRGWSINNFHFWDIYYYLHVIGYNLERSMNEFLWHDDSRVTTETRTPT